MKNASVVNIALMAALLATQSCKQDGGVQPAGTQTAGSISTVIGSTNQTGFGGDGGPAKEAKLSFLTAVSVDAVGNVYVVDGAANVVRKVNSDGIISTVAGSFYGFNSVDPVRYSGDGGPATAARLNVPYGVAIAASGNMYIADEANQVIRKFTAATGVISTIAGNANSNIGYEGDGGPALGAKFWDPNDLAVDAAENVYIADKDNHVIRKIDASTGIITTIAGLGPDHAGYSGDGGLATAAALNTPAGVAVDKDGNIYIADGVNNVIRKITASTGMISTVAGSGPQASGYSGDGGPATTAKLNIAYRVAVDGSGNLYISDGGNHVIRKVEASTGFISTLAGTGDAGYSGDGGPATEARLKSPDDVAVDGLGNVYISDYGNSVVRKVVSH